MRIICFRCSSTTWEEIAVEVFASCAYLILRCLGCHLEIAHRVPRAQVAHG